MKWEKRNTSCISEFFFWFGVQILFVRVAAYFRYGQVTVVNRLRVKQRMSSLNHRKHSMLCCVCRDVVVVLPLLTLLIVCARSCVCVDLLLLFVLQQWWCAVCSTNNNPNRRLLTDWQNSGQMTTITLANTHSLCLGISPLSLTREMC